YKLLPLYLDLFSKCGRIGEQGPSDLHPHQGDIPSGKDLLLGKKPSLFQRYFIDVFMIKNYPFKIRSFVRIASMFKHSVGGSRDGDSVYVFQPFLQKGIFRIGAGRPLEIFPPWVLLRTGGKWESIDPDDVGA